jgi:hypothetical protein
LLVSAEAVGEKLLTRDRRLKVAAESLGRAMARDPVLRDLAYRQSLKG